MTGIRSGAVFVPTGSRITATLWWLKVRYYQGESGVENSVGHLDPPEQMVVDANQPVTGGDVVLRWDRTFSAKSNFYLQGYFDRTNRGGPLRL